MSVYVTGTLNVADASMYLLSMPALVNKNIFVLFVPDKAMMIDMEDSKPILRYKKQDTDGIFYILDVQEAVQM